MKNLFFYLFLFASVSVYAQAGFSFQASFKEQDGKPAANKKVPLRFIISDIKANTVYSEDQSPTTDAFGLVQLTIGGGSGFSNIDWSKGPFILRVDCDADGDGKFELLSSGPLLQNPLAAIPSKDSIIGDNYIQIIKKKSVDGHSQTQIGLSDQFIKELTRGTLMHCDSIFKDTLRENKIISVFIGLKCDTLKLFDDTKILDKLNAKLDAEKETIFAELTKRKFFHCDSVFRRDTTPKGIFIVFDKIKCDSVKLFDDTKILDQLNAKLDVEKETIFAELVSRKFFHCDSVFKDTILNGMMTRIFIRIKCDSVKLFDDTKILDQLNAKLDAEKETIFAELVSRKFFHCDSVFKDTILNGMMTRIFIRIKCDSVKLFDDSKILDKLNAKLDVEKETIFAELVSRKFFHCDSVFKDTILNGMMNRIFIRIKCDSVKLFDDSKILELTFAHINPLRDTITALKNRIIVIEDKAYIPLPANPVAGQVLKWNGSAWLPNTDLTAIGSGNTATASPLIGDGSAGNPITLAPVIGTSVPQILKWTNGVWSASPETAGQKGDKGDTGTQGIPGPVGPAGPVGAAGAQGNVGPQGPAGASGAQGIPGPQGPPGANGQTGSQGITGPQGPTGPAGTYIAGTGISISGQTISAQNTTALWNANQLQGRNLSSTAPGGNQVLKWNTSANAWGPANDDNAAYTGSASIQIAGTVLNVADDGITNAKVADNAIGTAELANNAVTNSKIADNAVGTQKINDGGVGLVDLVSPTGKFLLAGTYISWDGNSWAHTEESNVISELTFTGTSTAGSLFSGNNQVDLGRTSNRWKTIYSVNALNTSSDLRLKKNIEGLNYGLAQVLKMRPVSYNWNTEKNKEKKHLGFIAQEMNNMIPEVVESPKDEKNDFYGMKYSELVPVLVKAIQEQQAIIDIMQKEIKELKSKSNIYTAKN